MPARGEDRSADAILKEIVAITLPEADLSRVADKPYFRQFMKQRSEIRVRRAELIGALYRADPDNPRLVTLLPVRWRSLSGRLGGPDDNEGARDLTGELNEVLARATSDELKKEAAYIKAWIASDPVDRIGSAKNNIAKAKAVDEFIAFASKDERGAELLYLLSLSFKDEPARQKALYAKFVKNEISWPQYYQGNGGESDFSRSLGINSIPTVFLVDQKGKLCALDAGDKLETLIPELMNRVVTKDGNAEGR
jgi:hypothetical protein